MSKNSKNLAGDAHFDDVDFFDIGSQGLGRGGEVNPMWGAVAGTGVGTLSAVGVTQFTDADKYAELIGLGAAVVVGGIMAIFRSTRSAGLTAMAAGALNNGVRAAAALMSQKQAVKDATGAQVTQSAATTKGIGAVYTSQVPGLGAVRAQGVPSLGMPPGAPPFDSNQWGSTGVSRGA